MAELQFPLQYKRQYNAPLDVDMRFDTLIELNSYLSSARRYAGMLVTCLEAEGKVFVLNNAEDAWVEIAGSGAGDMSTNTYDLAGKAEQVLTISDKGSPSGVASLDANGKIETNQLPPLSITSVFVVASELEQLALVAEEGDVAVRTDEEKTYMKNSGVAGDMTDWTYLATKPDAVLSVNGYDGVVSLASTDLTDATSIAYNNLDNTFSTNQSYSGTPSFSLGNEIITKKYADDKVGVVQQVFTDVKNPTGFVDPQNATIGFDELTRTVTVFGTFTMYYHGGKIEKIAVSDTVIIDDISGVHFVYYNSVGNLISTTTPISFDNIIVTIIYWNSTNQKGRKTYELHTAFRSWIYHEYLHNTLGTVYQSGLGGVFSNTTMEISSGIIWDEDIKINIPTQSAFAVFYKNGEPTFSWTDLQTLPYLQVAGNIQYNNGNSIVPVPNNSFVATWVFATNDLDSPIIILTGQRVDNQIQNARANNLYENLSLTDLPFQEYKVLYRVIYQQTSGGVQYIESQDLRPITSSPSSTYIATDHQLLSNRGAEDSHPAFAISYDNSISGMDSIEVKSSIDELDERRKNLSGGSVNFPTCADNGDGTITIGTSTATTTATTTTPGDVPGIRNATSTGMHRFLMAVNNGLQITDNHFVIFLNEQVTAGPADTRSPFPAELFDGQPVGDGPEGLLSGVTTAVEVSVRTNKFAYCRYSTEPDTPFGNMTREFDRGGQFWVFHTFTVFNTQPLDEYNFFVRCIDLEDNVNDEDYEISFSIAEEATGSENPDGVIDGGGSGDEDDTGADSDENAGQGSGGDGSGSGA